MSEEALCTRFLQLMNIDEKERPISQPVQQYLSQSPRTTSDEFSKKIAATVNDVNSVSLASYRDARHLKAAWTLTRLVAPVCTHDMLSHSNPEKTGILCQTSGSNERHVLTPEDLHGFGLFDNPEVRWEGAELESVLDLYFSLEWWRRAVCCVWAANIMEQLTRSLTKDKSLLFLPDDNVKARPKNSYASMDTPLRSAFSFDFLSNREIATLAKLHEDARFGSGSCGEAVADAFRSWLGSVGVGTLHQHGLSFRAAEMLMKAASRRTPRIVVGVNWSEEMRTFVFTCELRNLNAQGFDDPSASTPVPSTLLMGFIETANSQTHEDLFRMLIRDGWRKASDLLYPSLVS